MDGALLLQRSSVPAIWLPRRSSCSACSLISTASVSRRISQSRWASRSFSISCSPSFSAFRCRRASSPSEALASWTAYHGILHGLAVAATPMHLLYTLIGVFIGTMISHLPGIGPSAGIALLIPVTFGMDPTSALMMLTGIYYGCMYGGAVTAILLNTPGDAAAVMTVLDGYPLARKGRAAATLAIAAVSSFIAGMMGVTALSFVAAPLAAVALHFGPDRIFRADLLRAFDRRRADRRFARQRHDGRVPGSRAGDDRHRPAKRRAALHARFDAVAGSRELPRRGGRPLCDLRGEPNG